MTLTIYVFQYKSNQFGIIISWSRDFIFPWRHVLKGWFFPNLDFFYLFMRKGWFWFVGISICSRNFYIFLPLDSYLRLWINFKPIWRVFLILEISRNLRWPTQDGGCEEKSRSRSRYDVTGLFSRPQKKHTIHLPSQEIILSMCHIFTFSNMFL